MPHSWKVGNWGSPCYEPTKNCLENNCLLEVSRFRANSHDDTPPTHFFSKKRLKNCVGLSLYGGFLHILEWSSTILTVTSATHMVVTINGPPNHLLHVWIFHYKPAISGYLHVWKCPFQFSAWLSSVSSLLDGEVFNSFYEYGKPHIVKDLDVLDVTIKTGGSTLDPTGPLGPNGPGHDGRPDADAIRVAWKTMGGNWC